MKKIILYTLLLIMVFVSCSPRKNRFTNRTMQRFTSYYNTLFNGEQALEQEIKERSEFNKNDFYAPYINILPHDNPYVGGKSYDYEEEEDVETQQDQNSQQEEDYNQSQLLQLTEAKAAKTIEKHTMLFTGGEKNRMIFDAYILIVRSKLYQNEPYEALTYLNYLLTNMKQDKRFPLAKIYEAISYSKLKDYYRATELFIELEKTEIPKKYRSFFYIYYGENLLLYGEKEKSLEKLEQAFSANKNRKTRSRIAYLQGQILTSMDKNKEANEKFRSSYKLSNDFEFQVKSLIEMAKNFDSKENNYEDTNKYIAQQSKKGIFRSKKNELYYALGILAKKDDKKQEAFDYFQKSLEGEPSDNQIRGQAYFEIGTSYFDKDNYIKAGTYYDSALVSMDYKPAKLELKKLNEKIKKFSKSYYIVKENDSVLFLVNMNEDQRKNHFTTFINDLKEKEKQEEIKEKKNKREKELAAEFVSANSSFLTNEKKSGKTAFYFSNPSTVSKGGEDFKKTWGNRALVDNWRHSVKAKNSENTSSQEEEKTETPGNPRRFESEFYIEKIPTDEAIIADLRKDRDSASLDVGRMYDEYFNNTPLATKTLYQLADVTIDKEVKLQALYLVFVMNYENNPQQAERVKNIILQEFADTPYAEFVKNPKSSNLSKSRNEVEQAYDKAFQLYESEKFAESVAIIDESIEKYEQDALLPKFELLKAFNAGKMGGKNILKVLQKVHVLYPKTEEGKKANELYKYLKKHPEITKFEEELKLNTEKEASEVVISDEIKDEKPLPEKDISKEK